MSPSSPILLDYRQLPSLVRQLKKQNQKIVLTQGTFDMLHIGHGRYLEKAKRHGEILFVGVDSDEKVRARKGPTRPVVPESERMEMLSYMSSVDYVVLKPKAVEKWKLIKLISPDVLIATEGTYTPTQIKGLEKICGQVVVLNPQATTSTSAKLRRLQIGFAQDFSQTLTKRIHTAIDQVTAELMKKPVKHQG